MDLESTAWQTYMQVKQQTGERVSSPDVDLPATILEPEERVLDLIVGDTSSEDEPMLLATDRRVLLARRPSFRRWRILREAPGAEVVDASWTQTLLAGRLSVHLRDGSHIDLRVRNPERAERFIASVRGLLGR